MNNKIESFLDLRLSEIIEIQPYPLYKYIFIKTKTKTNFKINIPDEIEFFEGVNKIKTMLGYSELYSTMIPRPNKYRKAIYIVDGKIYNKASLISLGINVKSLEKAIYNQSIYFGKFWKKYVYKSGKWKCASSK